MLISETVEVNLSSNQVGYYENLGYEIPRSKNKWGRIGVSPDTKLVVKVDDLPKGSGVKVIVKCDYCLKEIEKGYREYLNCRKIIQKDCCNNPQCRHQKQKESMMLTYGVEHPSLLEEVNKKRMQTNIERYGVSTYLKTEEYKIKSKETNLKKYGIENPMQNIDVQNKAKNTRIELYGVEHSLQNPDILKKASDTMLERYGKAYYPQTEEYKEKNIKTLKRNYGVDSPLRSEIIKDKIKETSLERYGYEHPMKSFEVQQKVLSSLYENGTQKVSKQQLYIHKLIGGELNFLVSRMFLDIAFPEDKIYIEYDGGFHNGRVICGLMTQEEFEDKEFKRSCQLSDWGWKEIRIISKEDNIPSDEMLLNMINIANNYLKSGHSWIKFNIDNQKIITSQYDVDFDYGYLRRIKEEDLKEVS